MATATTATTWQHKGFEIELVGANFVAQVTGRRVVGSSLAAAKKAIDKHQELKAKQVELKLPVVMLRSKGRYSRKTGTGDIIRATITGLDPANYGVLGLQADGDEDCLEYVLPDVAGNDNLLAEFIHAELAYEKAKAAVDCRVVPRHFSRYNEPRSHRHKPYDEVVKMLTEGYKLAVKGKSDD